MQDIINVKKNPVSLCFFLLCASVFLVARGTSPENVRFLALDHGAWPGRWWAILTYGIVHVDWNHIIVNMGLLLWIGIWVERLVGSGRFTVLVLVGILGGGLSIILRETAGIGFSAAAAALLFYYHFAFPLKRELPLNLPNLVLPVALLVLSVGAVIFGWLPSVGHVPHLAGAAVGMVFLVMFRKHHRPL